MSDVDNRSAVVESGPQNVPALASERRGRGAELVDREDILITRVQVDGKSGGFKWVGSSLTSNELTITPIFFFKTRILFGDRDKDEPVVMCRSSNANYPTDWDGEALEAYGMKNPAPDCPSCDFNRWTKDPKTGDRKPPRCRCQYNFLVHVAETNEVAVLSIHGTSLSAAKQITSDGARGVSDFWAKTYRLTTKKSGQGTRTYFSLEVAEVRDTEPQSVLDSYEQLYESVVGNNPKRAAELLSGGAGRDQDDTTDIVIRATSSEPEEIVPEVVPEVAPEEEVPF